MLYIVFTTGQCNLKCKYCGGSFPPERVPWEVEYPIDYLKEFISEDPDPIIAFYGGEPLLNADYIVEVMDEIPYARFVIQTNGTIAEALKPDYWLRFDAVLLSIDGRNDITNYYRGAKVYERVVNTAKWLKSNGFKNDLIARMTVSELSDIYSDVTNLLSLSLFDHIHWQLNVIWNNHWKSFDYWCENSYLPGIRRLIELWIKEARKGKVLGIVPFLSILKAMIKDERLDCPHRRAGVNSVAISTNGDILACPIAVDVRWANLGNILKDSRTEVINKVKIGEPCISCRYIRYCGGRCLYAHLERFWGENGFKKVCQLTMSLIDELAKTKDEVLNLLERRIISLKDIEYPPFNNTTEIIP